MRRKNKYALFVLAGIMTATLLCSCGTKAETLQDGYYTAQAAEFSHGWKEYVTIMVKDGKVVSAEHNAENASGFVKSWDNAYMQNMVSVTGAYPNAYTRYYSSQLIGSEGEVEIDAMTGATTSYQSFQKLSAAAMEQARQGNSNIAIVDTE